MKLIKPKTFVPVTLGVAFTMLWVFWPGEKALDNASAESLLEFSAEKFASSNPSHTNIIISGKTMIIQAADGYTPTVENGEGKPMVILERDPEQKSAAAFDNVTVKNEI